MSDWTNGILVAGEIIVISFCWGCIGWQMGRQHERRRLERLLRESEKLLEGAQALHDASEEIAWLRGDVDGEALALNLN